MANRKGENVEAVLDFTLLGSKITVDRDSAIKLKDVCSAFFIGQLLHPYMNTGKTIALTRWTFVGKVMSLLFNMLSRLVITFLPRSFQFSHAVMSDSL